MMWFLDLFCYAMIGVIVTLIVLAVLRPQTIIALAERAFQFRSLL